MAPRKDGVEEQHKRLTAVVLADTFQQRFRPITVERPNVLLPLVNTPMLDYVLEWLANNDVEEVYVFCCSNADKIQKHIRETKWGSQQSFEVKVVISTNCFSAGEAMRLIDQQDIIKDDFVLISGDCISNMNLKPALEAHKQRREKDKLSIMTAVVMPLSHPDHLQLLGGKEVLMSIDPATQRLLAIKDVDVLSSKAARNDNSMFSERDTIQLRMDLTESQIYICSPEVLLLFSDNFDFQNVRRDFITGVLSEEELGNKIFLHELKGGEYGVRVDNLRTYDAVSRDIINRWTFPWVPDTNSLQSTGPWLSSYTFQHRNIYLDSTVSVAHSVQIGPDTVIGADTTVDEQCCISASVIGRGCRIGSGVNISGCYIHDSVVIHEGVSLQGAIVCDRVVIKRAAVINQGAILSYGVVVGPGHEVPAFSRLTLCQQGEEQLEDSDDETEFAGGNHGFDSDGEDDGGNAISSLAPTPAVITLALAIASGQEAVTDEVQWAVDVCGAHGAGFTWMVKDKDDEARCSVAPPPAQEATWELLPGEALDIGVSGQAGKGNDGEEDEAGEWDPDLHFKKEVAETFLRCVKMRFDQANATIELNALKLAENKTFADCANYIFTTILGMCLPPPPKTASEYQELYAKEMPDLTTNPGKMGLLRQLKAHLVEWGPLLQKFLREDDDQVDLLLTLEEFCGSEGYFASERGSVFAPLFCQVLQILYDIDILSEEACVTWAGEKEHADEEDKMFLKKAQPFLTWLNEAESEEEDESDDEDD